MYNLWLHMEVHDAYIVVRVHGLLKSLLGEEFSPSRKEHVREILSSACDEVADLEGPPRVGDWVTVEEKLLCSLSIDLKHRLCHVRRRVLAH